MITNSKKGFTLIELLAVIVILAIIALIATPIILNMINYAKKSASKDSAYGYIEAIEYENQMSMLDNKKYQKINDGEYSDIEEITNRIKLKGTKPTSGNITITNGRITEAELCIDKYIVIYNGKEASVKGSCNTKIVPNYKEEILNGADPVIKDDLIPVVINDDGTVTKADLKKEWYKYENKNWANAVILKDTGKIENDNTIKEESIKEYYVWIPKYAYKLWNVNSNNTEMKEKPIEITFGSKAKTTGENNGDTYIHPAFTNFNTNGIWVGKYEISYDEETYTNKETFLTKNPNTSVTTDSKKLIVKPNVRSLTNKNVSSLFTLIKNSHTNLNSHMMTNMEWGAIAYLTYSKYGRCNSSTCTEVTINNINTGYYGKSVAFSGQLEYGATITGCAGDTVSASYISNSSDCTNKYNTAKGYLASTTGNITGIYDMSGGSWEYVMGVLEDSNGNLYSGDSGFKGLKGNVAGANTSGLDFPDKKYYDSYVSSDAVGTDNWYKYTSGKLGDATKEIANTKTNSSNDRGLWFNASAYFVSPTCPFFDRGGSWNNGTESGVLCFTRDAGNSSGHISARSVLAY